MNDLGSMLDHLQEEDVKELLLRAGSRPTLRTTSGEMRALPGVSLNFKSMLALVGTSPIAKLVGKATPDGYEEQIDIDGAAFSVTVVKRGVDLQVRVRQPGSTKARGGAGKRLQLKTPEPEKRAAEKAVEPPRPKPDLTPPEPDEGGGDDALAKIFGRSLSATSSDTGAAAAAAAALMEPPPATPAPTPAPAPAPAPSQQAQLAAAPAPAPRSPEPRRNVGPTPIVDPPPPAEIAGPDLSARRKATTKPVVEPPKADISVHSAKPRRRKVTTRSMRRRRNVAPSKRPHPHLVSSAGYARQLGASDIIMAPDRPLLLRVRGRLEPHGDPLPAGAVEQMLDTLMGAWHADALDRRGRVTVTSVLEEAGRVRVNASLSGGGMQASIRLISPEPIAYEQLGLPPTVAEGIGTLSGLILVTSPSGHGKSTTLSGLIHAINTTRPAHVLALAEPVEIVHQPQQSLVTQREIGAHCVSWARAIAAARLLDADVIAIDELKDSEAIEAALAAAQAGRLVVAAMTAPSGLRAVDTLLDRVTPARQAAARSLLSRSLRTVLFQRLLRTADGEARVPACEVILGSVSLSRMIAEAKMQQLPGLMQRGRALGMQRLEDSVEELLQEGRIDAQTAARFMGSKKAKKALKQAAKKEGATPTTEDGPSRDTEDNSSLGDKLGSLFKRKKKK